MKKITLLFLILLSTYSLAQHPTGPSLADKLREEKKYNEAIKEYLILEKTGQLNEGTEYNFSKALASAKKIDSCFLYLNKIIDRNLLVQSLTEIEFIEIKDDKRWADYEERVINAYLPSNDLSLSVQIYRIIALCEKDENNINSLFKLINKKGWPKRSQVGEAADYILSFRFKNLFIKKSKKYIKELKTLCLEGEIDCEYFAELYDRIQKNSNKPQKYGTIYDYNNEKYYKFIDEKNINEWRNEIGLKQLKEYSE